MASRIHFKYQKNILISRLYEQFSRNDSTKAPQCLQRKTSLFIGGGGGGGGGFNPNKATTPQIYKNWRRHYSNSTRT